MVLVLAPATVVLLMLVVAAAALQEATRRKKNSKRNATDRANTERKGQTATIINNNNNNEKKHKHHRLENKEEDSKATTIPLPGPTPIPVLGNLHLMGKYNTCPYEGFSALGRQYGNVYALSFGNTQGVVVGDYDAIKEVLVNKANQFDARPNLIRFGLYFGGNRQHSLALCDWSEMQKRRIALARSFLMFKGGKSSCFEIFEENVLSEMPALTNEIDNHLNTPINAKEILSYCAMNIFTGYMCSKKFEYEDNAFRETVKLFDFIFDDINNGHPTDFLPWLTPFYSSYIKKVNSATSTIRKFILDRIAQEKHQSLERNPKDINDLVDACFSNLINENKEDDKWDWQTILYIIEDLLGGSSAIGNIVMRYMGYVLRNPSVLERLRAEIENNLGAQPPTLADRQKMQYSQAVLYEVLRVTSSPIVPHVATEDTSIAGFQVDKGSMIILNNYEMNSSSDLWEDPLSFKPERFIVDGQLVKPAHFMPFSTGKRSCVGKQIVSNVTFIVTTTLLQQYDIRLPEDLTPELPRGKISLSWDAFPLIFSKRS